MNWIVDFILGLLIILCFYLTPIKAIQYFIIFASTADEYFSAVVLCLILPVTIYKTVKEKKNIKITKITLLFAFWLLYATITLFWATDYFRYFTEIIQLFISVILLYLVYIIIDTPENLIKILNSLAYSGALVALLSVVNYSQFKESAINYYAIIALFTLIVYPLARFNKLREWGTIKIFIQVCLGILIIQIHDSRAALGLSGIIILWRFFWLNKINKKIKYGLLLVFTAVFTLYLSRYLVTTDYFLDITDTQQNFSNLERISLLQQTWDLFVTHPFGMGQGACNGIFMKSQYTVLNYPHPHNTFAHLMVELGFVGLIIYIILLIHIFKSWRKANKFKNVSKNNYLIFIALGLSFLILFSYSFFEDFLFNGVFNLYIFVFIGICLAMEKLIITSD